MLKEGGARAMGGYMVLRICTTTRTGILDCLIVATFQTHKHRSGAFMSHIGKDPLISKTFLRVCVF